MGPDHAATINDDAVRLPAAVVHSRLTGNDLQIPSRDWQEAEEIHLRDYIDVIVRRKWLILSIVALVFLSTSVFTLSVTRIYEAAATIEVSQETPHVTTFQEVLGSEIQAREFYETQVELLHSRAMIDRVIVRRSSTAMDEEVSSRSSSSQSWSSSSSARIAPSEFFFILSPPLRISNGPSTSPAWLHGRTSSTSLNPT